jgi:predicted metal-dependent hydrolase
VDFRVFAEEHLKKMEEGIHLFNEQKYWECHEALEEVWLEDRQDPVRNIYWAVIQVAAACIHYRNSNLIGCQGMISKAKEKFKRCREFHVLSDLALKYLDWVELEQLALKIPDGASSKIEDFEELYKFRFKTYSH